mmetsp:Transcript_38670/g.45019  ORF Transcript_38670/g.45019 Transcript_38670/m.45019 type:complete len:199 (-) Transcript_38670:12-608(-)
MPIPRVRIDKIRLITTPKFGILGGCTPYFSIRGEPDFQYRSKSQFTPTHHKNAPAIEFAEIKGVELAGDIYIQFFHKPLTPMASKEKMFQLWFNTGFLVPEGLLTVEKNMLDKAIKDKKNKKFSPDFKIEIYYTLLDEQSIMKKSFLKKVRESVISEKSRESMMISQNNGEAMMSQSKELGKAQYKSTMILPYSEAEK